jgi:hypothetical protein
VSCPRPPWIANVAPVSAPLLPPTSVLRVAPGVKAAKFVPVFGSARITCIWMTFCCVTFCVSTIGERPVTVIVSSSAPTFNSPLTVAVKPAESSMPSRLTVLNPASVNVTA